ncbi:hypothetical protein INR49_029827, partial [Caranx melampygus]
MAAALADIFAEDSESERTFYGFSDSELSDKNSNSEDEAHRDLSPRKQTTTSKPPGGKQAFRLRVALRSAASTQQSTDEEDEVEEKAEEEAKKTEKRVVKKTGKRNQRRVKFEDEDEAETCPPPGEERGSDSGEEMSGSFLAKRAQNIKANKAMLAQLMADLQKMPGVTGLLKKQAGKQMTKERSSRPPRSGAAGGESRRNPERASRRQTRSMGGCEDALAPKKEEIELSLEEELLEVRKPQRRGTPRPHQSKPHLIRPVEDITEDELQLIADTMTDKVYDRVAGSTCHQCRQKTIDTKTCCHSEECRGIQGQFCGPCLRNRYGEDVKKALLDPEWKCPPCRGICNCSFCRQREGRCPTGILFPLAQYHGFSDVHSYLSRSTCIMLIPLLANRAMLSADKVSMVTMVCCSLADTAPVPASVPAAGEAASAGTVVLVVVAVATFLFKWVLMCFERYSSTCSSSLSLTELGERLYWGQRDLCSSRILDLNGLPAHLAIWAYSAQEDGACVWHNLKILKPLLAECWSRKYLTACGRDRPSLDGLEGCSTLDNLLRLEKD